MKKIADFISRFGFHTTPFTCEIAVSQHFVNEPYSQALQHIYRAVDIWHATSNASYSLSSTAQPNPLIRSKCNWWPMPMVLTLTWKSQRPQR